MKVEIKLAKNTHSEPMNDQIPILRTSIPPDDGACSGSCDSWPKSAYSNPIPMIDSTTTTAPMMTIRYQSMISPKPIVPTPRLITSGKIDGAGMWMCTSADAVAGGCGGACPDI